MSENNSNVRLEMTSTAFKGPGGEHKYQDCRDVCSQLGFDFGVQLHNSICRDQIEWLASAGVSLSAHAPLLSKHGINLAAESFDLSHKIIQENVALFLELGVTKAVFHGFNMTDIPVPAYGHGRSYNECMSEIFRPELSINGKSRMCNDFTSTPEYRTRLHRVKEHLLTIRGEFPQIVWCIENDFPAFGSANLFSENSAFLKSPICLDSSHLWTTCHLFDRDFHDETEKFLSDCQVEMIHLHASKYTAEVPKADWDDGHLPLRTPNEMDLPRFVRSCRDAGINYFVLEVSKGTYEDIHAFAEMWNS
ncbi:MAG: hypothetical protein GY750_08850 [Lentisphaerae bacterium]|nr:hypothetical protein [Lentisphaerota bacterium]MCP4101519.1 hypothetical protein [Lentisphaerota bacterium]